MSAKLPLNQKALDAAIVVGSNMAGEDLVRAIVTEYLTVAGLTSPAAMSADTAPAAMPGVEDVARLLCKLDGLNPDLPRSWADKELLWTEWLDPARQVIALFAPILAENAFLKTTEGAARAWCRSKGIDPDFYYDGARDWQKLALIDITAEDLKAALAEEEDDHRKTEARALAAEAALAEIKAKHAEWRKCMPADWEGDPLSHAIEAAAIRAQGE